MDRQATEGILESVKPSRCAAPVVPVKKANGTLRLCGNYDQTVNKVRQLEEYPLPRFDETPFKEQVATPDKEPVSDSVPPSGL